MKKIFVVLLSLLIVIFAVLPAGAVTTSYTAEDITFSLSDGYTVYTKEDLAPGSEVEGLLFFAVSGDGKHSIQARRTQTEFSKQIGTFSGLDSEMIKPIGEKIFAEGFETVQISSGVYLKSITAEGNGYTAVYVTARKGKLYTFTYFGSDPTKAGEFLSTVTLPKDKERSGMWVYTVIIISVFILFDVAFIVVLVLSFIRDYRRRKMERDRNIVSQYIKIKRRKY